MPQETNGSPQKVFDVATDGHFYGGIELNQKAREFCPNGESFAALRDDGSLGFHINFSNDLGSMENLSKIEKDLKTGIERDGINIYTEKHGNYGKKFGSLKILLAPNGEKIDKSFDTKAALKSIIKNNSNDLIIEAGDGANDVKMLDLFEYIDFSDGKTFSAENLKKIYKLPFVSIYVDNTSKSLKPLSNENFSFDIADDFFNSDGNVRFIHVDPTNPKKPQNLQEALPVAIKEYAKRNKKFRNNLSPEMRGMIEKLDYEYPINREITKTLEKQTGQTLWNPSPSLKIAARQTKIKTFLGGVIALIALCGMVPGCFIHKKNFSKKAKKDVDLTELNGLYIDSLPEVFIEFKTAKNENKSNYI